MSDESKLPKWARDELTQLRGRVSYLEELVRISRGEAQNSGATGKVIVEGWDGSFPLYDRTVIRFMVGENKISVMLRENGTLLDINALHGTLAILPRAANCAYAKVLND
jgi:hypothetical protein